MMILKGESPILSCILLKSFRKVLPIKQRTFQIKLQLLKLIVELLPCVIVNLIIKVIANYHLTLSPGNNLLQFFFKYLLLIGLQTMVWDCINWLFYWLFSYFWLISIEKLQQLRQLLNIYCGQKSIVVVLQLFFSLLNKVFLGISEQFFMRELRQIIFFWSKQTSFMYISHMTIPLSKSPGLILFRIENLNCIPYRSILVFHICEFDNIFGLFVHVNINIYKNSFRNLFRHSQNVFKQVHNQVYHSDHFHTKQSIHECSEYHSSNVSFRRVSNQGINAHQRKENPYSHRNEEEKKLLLQIKQSVKSYYCRQCGI